MMQERGKFDDGSVGRGRRCRVYAVCAERDVWSRLYVYLILGVSREGGGKGWIWGWWGGLIRSSPVYPVSLLLSGTCPISRLCLGVR